MSLSIGFDMAGLRSMAADLGAAADEAARPAAQAAADVLYREVQKNVNQIGKRSGNLARSIYQAYSKSNSGPGVATYHVSWNARTAPHGMFLEWGYLQRYEYYKDDAGKIRPRVRPEMIGTKKPSSNGRNRAKLDAYYVTLPTPKQIPARAFIRRAESAFPAAEAAAKDKLIELMFRDYQ